MIRRWTKKRVIRTYIILKIITSRWSKENITDDAIYYKVTCLYVLNMSVRKWLYVNVTKIKKC